MRVWLMLITLMTTISLSAISFLGDNRFEVNNESLSLELCASKRTNTISFVPISFVSSGMAYPDSSVITYDSPELTVTVCVTNRTQYSSLASLFAVRTTFKREVYIHELYFLMRGKETDPIAEFKGVSAIRDRQVLSNRTITSFMDKAVEYSFGDSRFWIVASNYAECDGIEGLTDNRITLYDYRGHFFRYYTNGTTLLLRDCLTLAPGKHLDSSFLMFDNEPILLEINRWLGNKPAALCITNDADMEDVPRLMAAYWGSDNPANLKYLTQGFFAHNIPVTSTVFGINQPILDDLWTEIKARGNTIGYHTYSPSADDMALSNQSLLYDLAKYNIRTWIDHALPTNPEDIAYNGANPTLDTYVMDMIDQSSIDYLWTADTPPTNPFNAYDEAWRLPHKLYEIPGINRPMWFYGRTRMEAWEYNSSSSLMVSFKYMMTADNLDKLISDRGLHICYTHFCSSNTVSYNSFWTNDTNGDYIIRDDVEEMLQMLARYRDTRNLWIATSEDIFDRMLDIDELKVISVSPDPESTGSIITLKNCSERLIPQIFIRIQDKSFNITDLAPGESTRLYTAPSTPLPTLSKRLCIKYSDGRLKLKNRDSQKLHPMQVEIFNLRGQQVMTQELTFDADQMNIVFKDYPSGVYLAKIRSNYDLYPATKFVVVK